MPIKTRLGFMGFPLKYTAPDPEGFLALCWRLTLDTPEGNTLLARMVAGKGPRITYARPLRVTGEIAARFDGQRFADEIRSSFNRALYADCE